MSRTAHITLSALALSAALALPSGAGAAVSGKAVSGHLISEETPEVSPQMEAIAQCESGGDPKAVGGGAFYGKYQFTLETWEAMGGKGNPVDAPEAEQDRRAQKLMDTSGPQNWPVCSR